MEIMQDPVVLSTGQSYERHAISTWLRRNQTCPNTGLNVDDDPDELTPNIALRNAIQAFLEHFQNNVPQHREYDEGQRFPATLQSELLMAYCDGVTRDLLLPAKGKFTVKFQYANIFPFSFSKVEWRTTNSATQEEIRSGYHNLRYTPSRTDFAILFFDHSAIEAPVNLHAKFICEHWLSDFSSIGQSRVVFEVVQIA